MNMDDQQAKPSWHSKFKTFLVECKRVWQVTKKPTTQELKTVVKVTGIGILLVGLVGFLVQMIWQLILR